MYFLSSVCRNYTKIKGDKNMNKKPICYFIKGMVVGMAVASCGLIALCHNKKAIKKMHCFTSKACDNMSTMFKMK